MPSPSPGRPRRAEPLPVSLCDRGQRLSGWKWRDLSHPRRPGFCDIPQPDQHLLRRSNRPVWCSDNTDAIDRVRIQYGTSFGYPVSTMEAHVSAVPNGCTRRVTPIHTRAVVAMSGTFGYELDLNLLLEEEKAEVTAQIADFKKYWPILQNGLCYRLTDAVKNRTEAAWMMVAEDGGEALVNIVTLDITGNAPNRFLCCRGLDATAVYKDADTGICYPAAVPMAQGLPMPHPHVKGTDCVTAPEEYQAFQIHLIRQ